MQWPLMDMNFVKCQLGRTTAYSVPILVAVLWSLAAPVQAGIQALEYQENSLIVGGKRQVVRIPKGYRLEFLTHLDQPRMLVFAPNGDLFSGSKSGKVYRLPPPYTKPEVLVELDDYPHSVAFRPGEILIAQTNGLYRTPYQPGQARISPKDVKLLVALPSGGGHSSRTVGVGPEGRVYISVGISRNCSDQYLSDAYPMGDRRGGVMVLRESSGPARWEYFATGLRNPVGFDWQPQTGVLFASNNGPDHLGYDQPPEYFSKLVAGSFHGMPWFQFDGKKLQRDECISRAPPRPMTDVTLPVATFPSRNAPLGMAFVPKGAMDAQLELDAVVALHGSWGTQPGGGFVGASATRRPPKIVAVRFHNGQAIRVDDLISGFQLPDGDRWARPAGPCTYHATVG